MLATVEFHDKEFSEPWVATMQQIPHVGELVRIPHLDDYWGRVHQVEWIISKEPKSAPYVLVRMERCSA
jgi:hypothetical protein